MFFGPRYNAVMYRVFEEIMYAMAIDFYWTVVCTVVNKLCDTRCAMSISHQVDIPGGIVFKQIIRELKRQRTIDSKHKKLRPWHLLTLQLILYVYVKNAPRICRWE